MIPVAMARTALMLAAHSSQLSYEMEFLPACLPACRLPACLSPACLHAYVISSVLSRGMGVPACLPVPCLPACLLLLLLFLLCRS